VVQVTERARELNLRIPQPITFYELLSRSYPLRGLSPLWIDDLDEFASAACPGAVVGGVALTRPEPDSTVTLIEDLSFRVGDSVRAVEGHESRVRGVGTVEAVEYSEVAVAFESEEPDSSLDWFTEDELELSSACFSSASGD
jgi:hypothetical protein